MIFRVGQRVWIACDVKPGMSPNESSIRFVLPAPEENRVRVCPRTLRKDSLQRSSSPGRGVVASPPEKGKVRVLLPGEVLTSTNPILVDASWLSVHAA